MPKPIAVLTVRMSANSAQLVAEFSKVEKRAQTFNSKMLGFGKAVGAAFARMGIAAAAAFAYITVESFRSADALVKLTQRIGGSVEGLSRLQYAAKKSGIETNTLSMGLQRMTRRLAEAANDTGEAKAALKELGLNAAELIKLPLEAQFSAIAEELSRVGNSADKTRLAMKLFENEGVALLQTMAGGAAGIKELTDEADRLGITLDTDTANSAVKANDAFTELNSTTNALIRNLGLRLAPAALFAADALNELVRAATVAEEIEKLNKQIRELSGRAWQKGAAEKIKELESQIDLLRDKQRLLRQEAVEAELSLNSEFAESSRLHSQLAEQMDKMYGRNKRINDAQAKYRKDAEQVKALEAIHDAFEATNEELKVFQDQQDEIKRNAGDLSLDQLQFEQKQVHVALEKTNRTFDDLIDKQKESRNIARDLGLTFASAFEDAIVKGGQLRDVLKGIYEDVLRIIVRQTIIEPLFNGIGGIFGPRAPGGGGGGGGTSGPQAFAGGAAGGVAFGTSSKPGGVTIAATTYIDARGVDEARILRILPPILAQSENNTIARINALQLEGRI